MSFTREMDVKEVKRYPDGVIEYEDGTDERYFLSKSGEITDLHPGDPRACGNSVKLNIVTDFNRTATIA